MLALLGIVFSFVNAIFGNPVSAWIASNKIREYAAVTYPTLDLECSKVQYSLVNSAYGCHAQSRKSADTNFLIQYTRGKVTDDYEYEVANHFTTYRRLSKEFDGMVADIIEKEYAHKTTMIIGDLVGDTNPLSPDAPLDLCNMPLDLSLNVSMLADIRTDEQLAALLLELHGLMLSKDIAIDLYSLRLEEPLPEESKPGSGDNLYLTDFPAKSITDDIEKLALVLGEHRLAAEKNEKQ